MKDISDAIDLIATARELLLRDLLPTLPKDRRYAGLMVANAMAIAMREQASGDVAAHDEAARLRELFFDMPLNIRPAEAKDSAVELSVLRRAVCTAIRAGRFDGGARASALIAHLAQTAADWVAISNPKALREQGTGAGT